MGDSNRKCELHLGRTARKVKRNCPVAGQAVKEWIQTGTNPARIADSPAIQDLFRGLTAGLLWPGLPPPEICIGFLGKEGHSI